MTQNQDYMQEEEYCYDEEEPYPEEDPYEYIDQPLQSRPSKDKAYNVYGFEEITKKIYEENIEKQMLTCLPPEWNIMLYYFCNFSEQQLYAVLDEAQTGRKMIRFDQKYEPNITHDACMVCCEQQKLVSNACGHSFCFDCWKDFLNSNHTDRNVYELFPVCPWDGCFFRTNFKLMEKIWGLYPMEKREFDKLLCLKYSQRSDKVRMCGREGCSKAILINYTAERTLRCECGNQVCRICGQNDHFPLDCGDLKTWNKISSNKQQQWLTEIVTQSCPMCKTPIDKNGGCIHMTCKCGHQFCWICLQPWSGHKNYSECSSIKSEDHNRKLKEEQEKRKKDEGQYSVRFEEARCEIERIDNIVKRVKALDVDTVVKDLTSYHILTNDLLRLVKLKEMILEGMILEYHIQVYIFFERDGFKELQAESQYFLKLISKIDDYMFSRAGVVEVVTKELEKVNGQKVKMGQVLIEEVKNKFFIDWDYFHELLGNARKLYEEIREGKFMMTHQK